MKSNRNCQLFRDAVRHKHSWIKMANRGGGEINTGMAEDRWMKLCFRELKDSMVGEYGE